MTPLVHVCPGLPTVHPQFISLKKDDIERSQAENLSNTVAARDHHAVHTILPSPDPSYGSRPVSTQ